MDSDSDNQSVTDSETSIQETTQNDSIWDQIIRMTYANNSSFWNGLLIQDKEQFQLKFKESFLEKCKTWLNTINDFVENDETWAAVMETKSKLYETVEEDDEEALLSAIDARRYKLFKLIGWEKVEADLENSKSDENRIGDSE